MNLKILKLRQIIFFRKEAHRAYTKKGACLQGGSNNRM